MEFNIELLTDTSHVIRSSQTSAHILQNVWLVIIYLGTGTLDFISNKVESEKNGAREALPIVVTYIFGKGDIWGHMKNSIITFWLKP